MTFTKATVKTLNADLAATLTAWAAARGLTVRINGGSFSPLSFLPKVELMPADAGDGKSGPQAEFEQHAVRMGMLPEDFGRSYVSGGRTYTVVGLKLNAYAKPVLLRRDDGKTFVAATDNVRAMLFRTNQV